MGIQRPSVKRHELIGYTDRPNVAPGERLEFMVSSEFPEYDAHLVRLYHGDENPAGPGFKEREIDHPDNGRKPGARQHTAVGSYVRAPSSTDVASIRSFTARMWCRPSKPVAGHEQGLLSTRSDDGGGFVVGLDDAGHAFCEIGSLAGAQRVTTDGPLRTGVWYAVCGGYDAETGALQVRAEMVGDWPAPDRRLECDAMVGKGALGPGADHVLIAAFGLRALGGDREEPLGVFNGRIERPTIHDHLLDPDEMTFLDDSTPDRVGGLMAWWDFVEASGDFSTGEIRDRSDNALHGTTVNYPTRAVLGHRWDREVFNFADDPSQYSAIEFHDDDIEDSGWDVAIDLAVPADLESGVYALRLRADGAEDHIPFFVRPRRGTTGSDICLLFSTVTYQAYANESVLATSPDTDWSLMTDIPIVPDPYDVYSWDHPEFGYSIYDAHSDGSGINYSSWLRPIVNMRPKHRYWVTGAPRHFAADLYVVDWMTTKGFDHDVVTDHDLHDEGVELLGSYKVVVTSSHPEYWTQPMQDALEEYLRSGGRLVYLGGNGFYWVTAVDPGRPHLIEVRRGYSSARTWNSHPAETHLASTGERGGIWRFRGRSPNSITGVGFAAQGWSVKAPGFERLPDSEDPRAAFIFEGVDDRLIGDFGLVMNGSAGDEIDRYDVSLGTPPHALRLATSQGRHSRYYLVTHEDLLVTSAQVDGTNNENVRADMTYFEGPNGSAVFSLPAIGASSSLSHQNYDNNVSTIVANVLRRFTQ